MEKLIYPLKHMRITQHYNGGNNHYKHSNGSPTDYPIDDGGKDGGSDTIYAPCTCEVARIYGVGTAGVNTLWITSKDKIQFACGTVDYATIMIEHCTDASLKKLKVGQVVKQGEVLCKEGSDGASANHIHISVGKGKISGTGWIKNNKVAYVLTTTGGVYMPQNAFFVDTDFTKILNDGKITWRKIKGTTIKKEWTSLKTWKNGSTKEPVYSTVSDCKLQNNSIGSIATKGTAICCDIVDGCYLVHYTVGTDTKAGFVAYHGGIK